jgi:hypothetical protein
MINPEIEIRNMEGELINSVCDWLRLSPPQKKEKQTKSSVL